MPEFKEKPVAQAVRQGIAEKPAPEEEEKGLISGKKAKNGEPKGGGSDKSPEAQYAQLMDNISKLIDAEGEAQDNIMQQLQQGADAPAMALADATFSIGEAVFKQAESGGVQIEDYQLVAAAMETIMKLGELASEAGFFEVDEAIFANAYGATLLKWMQTHPDMIDWEGLQTSMGEADPQAVQGAQQMYGSRQAQPTPDQAAARQEGPVSG